MLPTVNDLASRYMAEHAEVHCKPLTVAGYRAHIRRYILPALGHIAVTDITRSDIASFHHSLSKVPYQANRCLEMISKMFNLAEMWGWRPDNTNPRKHIKRFKERMRERYLTNEETKKLIGIISAHGLQGLDQSAAYCLHLLLYTGCRLGEILTLKWSYVDFDRACLKLPDSKVGARDVYVSQNVIDLLQEIMVSPYRPITNPYVIWGQNNDEHLKGIQVRWQRFRKQAGLTDVRIHDLRHSFASYAVNQGISLAMIAKLLGHAQVQTTARYAHLSGESIRDAASQVGRHISATANLGDLMSP